MKIIEIKGDEEFPKLESYTRGDGALLVKLNKEWHLATKVEIRRWHPVCHQCLMDTYDSWFCHNCGHNLFESKTALELID